MPDRYVYPGGRVEKQDWDAAELVNFKAPSRCRSVEDAIYIAAIRETLEESGLLLGLGKNPKAQLDTETLREGLNNGNVSIETFLRDRHLCIRDNSLEFFAHWVTPTQEDKRYNTYFFIGAIDGQQRAFEDEIETFDGIWLTPDAALDGNTDGELMLAPPTLVTLLQLQTFDSRDEALSEFRDQNPSPIVPELRRDEGGVSVILPTHEDYDGPHPLDEGQTPGVIGDTLYMEKPGLWRVD
jgi:8-oxo-dGTP pyrophosphatase MutT (NUDIX family)